MTRQDIITAIEQCLQDLQAGNITLDAFFNHICDLDGDWQEVVDMEDEVADISNTFASKSEEKRVTIMREAAAARKMTAVSGSGFLTNTEADEDGYSSKDEVREGTQSTDELPPSKA